MIDFRFLGLEAVFSASIPLKCDLFGIGDVVSSIIGASSQDEINRQQIELARDQMAHQSEENQKSRDWSEEMWEKQNIYNTPSAMMERYKEAGLNPFLAGSQDVGLAGSPVSPSTTSQGSVPNLRAPQPPNFSGFRADAQLALQKKAVDAEAANQRSQSATNLVDAYVRAYKEGGEKLADKVVANFAPFFDGSDPEDSEIIKMMRSQRYNIDMDSLLKEFDYTTNKEWTPKEKQARFENVSASTNSLLYDAILKDSQSKLNEGQIKTFASQIAKNFADAFAAKKQGEYYEVSAEQMSTINKMLDLQYQDAYADFYLNNGVREFKYSPEAIEAQLGLFKGSMNTIGYQQQIIKSNAKVETNQGLRLLREISSDIGNVFKVNFGFSNNNTRFNNVTPNNPSQMFYSGDGFYMNNGTLLKGNW